MNKRIYFSYRTTEIKQIIPTLQKTDIVEKVKRNQKCNANTYRSTYRTMLRDVQHQCSLQLFTSSENAGNSANILNSNVKMPQPLSLKAFSISAAKIFCSIFGFIQKKGHYAD